MPEEYKQKVIDFFNGRTAYDREGDSHMREAKRLLEYVVVRSGQTILDLATGTGLVAIPAAKAVAPQGSVIGVDMSPGMLAQAKNKIVTEKIDNLELIEADVESINFKSEQFDLIFCCSALVYITDIPVIINKCYDWLKLGGGFAFTTPDRTSYLAAIKVKVCQDLFGIDLPHILRPLWTPEKCHTILQNSGFKDITIDSYQYRYNIAKNCQDGATRIERDFYPRGNPLLNLSEAQKQLLQVEYKKTVEQLIEKRGVWQDANNLYVKAWK
ncbi:MAG: class I SAM-dependent methyltransferase [Prochloraceae cyanobacterium]|nr:class I SAM-dependent methyltransferase [Prochloraceae cyanobacterium]